MAHVGSQSFWNNLYEQRKGCEWYYTLNDELLGPFIEGISAPVFILHAGCGTYPIESTNSSMVVVNFDYAPSFGQAIIESDVMGTGVDATDCRENPCESATQENGERERTCTITDYVSKLGCITELMVADARLMPYMDNSFDILIEKGLLDSMTADSNIQISNANKLMNEYHRVLKPKGKAIIQSIFAPGDEDKDMLGLLGHTGFEIECRELLISPPERPNSAFCFIYICRKLDENQ